MKALAKSLLIEFYDCNTEFLNNKEKMKAALLESAKISGAAIIKTVFHKFNPHGISGVIVIAESHFSVHTWPEYGYCAVDMFTCSENINCDLAMDYLNKKLSAESMSIVDVKRGVLNLPPDKVKQKN